MPSRHKPLNNKLITPQPLVEDLGYAVEVFCKIGLCLCTSSDDVDCLKANSVFPHNHIGKERKNVQMKKPPLNKSKCAMNSSVY